MEFIKELTLDYSKELPQEIIDEYDFIEDGFDDCLSYYIEFPMDGPNLNEDEMILIGKTMMMMYEKYGNKYGLLSTGERWFDRECIDAFKNNEK